MVENGTSQGRVPRGLLVTVMQTSPAGGVVVKREARVRERGTWSLGGFDADAGDGFIVTTTYKGVTYRTVADPSSGVAPVGLRIFETTRDESVISISSDTMIATHQRPGTMAVLQMLRVANTSDRTYIGQVVDGAPAVLRLAVPEAASELRAMEGLTHERIIDTPDGIAAGDPVQPGESRISYTYTMGASEGRWSMTRPVFYPTERADLLVQPELSVATPGRNLGTLTFQDITYRQVDFGPLVPGQEIVAGVDQPAGPSNPLTVVAAGGLLLTLLAALLLRRRRKWARNEPDEREQLMGAIAALDVAFAAGHIDESHYRSKRSEFKRELVSVGEAQDG